MLKKHTIVVVALFAILLLLAGYAQVLSAKHRNPAQVKVEAFYDDNKNGIFDDGEDGAQAKIVISQNVTCIASCTDTFLLIETNARGVALIEGIQPGRYCIIFYGTQTITTQLAREVYVSGNMPATVPFGIVRP